METLAVEAIRATQSATSAQAEAVGASGATPDRLASPSASAVSKFEAAMAANVPSAVSSLGPTGESPAAIPFATQASEAWHAAERNHQGLLHRIKALTELRAEHGPSASELVELQYEVMNLSFQQEVVTKIADKSSNAVQTLIKNQ